MYNDDDMTPVGCFMTQWASLLFLGLLYGYLGYVVFFDATTISELVKRAGWCLLLAGWAIIPITYYVVCFERYLLMGWFVPLKDCIADRCSSLRKLGANVDNQSDLSVEIRRLQEQIDMLYVEAATAGENSATESEGMKEVYTKEVADKSIAELQEKIDNFSHLSKWMSRLELRRYKTLIIYAVDEMDMSYGMSVLLPVEHWELLQAIAKVTAEQCKEKIAYIRANTRIGK